jgi:hypothetical protein
VLSLCVFIRIAALVEPERSTIGVRESQDANMKRARMQFKKLFSGSFNKVNKMLSNKLSSLLLLCQLCLRSTSITEGDHMCFQNVIV